MSAAAVMRERPILFSGPMVRAILDGSKTQTRRVVKGEVGERQGVPTLNGQPLINCPAVLCQCSYGKPGDRLWVRETWNQAFADGAIYRADYGHRLDLVKDYTPSGGWKPSIHMPRAASRLTLEVTGVRVERVQEISEADAIAEGTAAYADACMAKGNPRELTLIEQYQYLWDSLNASRGYGWDANPWVWVIEFARVAS